MLSIGDTVEMHGSISIHELKGYLRRTKYDVHEGIDEIRLSDLMNTLIDDGHDPDLFFEIFFCLFLFIELRIGSWESDLHIGKPPDRQDLVDESDDPQEEYENDVPDQDEENSPENSWIR